ncbi:mandelate racemase/muconate lactonizing enzyme family protein [Paenibacillus rhizovicinus]|uniref:Mandelate racemase/muconate lactonizing enzyme family protein n=1 Tax=Paenibacillus rhizovicinus TaxID=2704463 RepID=A0A6C0P3N0_9BACL|nr:mandelate racemase/muconate lactonizing enzyme family protein [Paenibacillus rhizovicinus]QHW33089.1 mandelate racemase/muconate lactonizing enzyme family protein [Paenibacillus rhizovicinus]
MKITDVEVLYLKLPQVDASRCDGTQDTLIVRVRTDEGIDGIGEIDSVPVVARAVIEAPPSHSIATGLKELLIGEDPFEVERLWDKMYMGALYYGRTGPVLHAMSGIDIALWDIIGKAANRPTAQMLGGIYRREIPVYASLLMPDTIAEAAKLAEKYMNLGYKAIKFGWGPIGRVSQAFDIELVRTIRSVIGDENRLMIDVGQVWDVKHAIRMAAEFERYGVYWMEEPLPPDDLTGYKLLSEQAGIYIATGEQESGRRSFDRLLREGGVDILQPDLGRCGGLTEARKIAVMAYDRNRKVVPHAFKTGVLVAASAHFAASMPQGDLIEYTLSDSPLARHAVANPLAIKDGCVRLPESPGLGIELDEQTVKKYLVT